MMITISVLFYWSYLCAIKDHKQHIQYLAVTECLYIHDTVMRAMKLDKPHNITHVGERATNKQGPVTMATDMLND